MSAKKFIDLKDNDVVEYHLFPLINYNNKNNLSNVNEIKENICRIVSRLSKNYIWHNEEFQIFPKSFSFNEYSEFKECEAFSFYGSLNYGENIEDEWFLVYILIQLSKEINDLVVKVKDADGEFLLIEAAEHLPSWVTPETCEDKVFIFNGHLQILPKSFSLKNEEFVLTDKIINFIRQNTDKTKVDNKVQEAIEKKIEAYPNRIEDNFHRVNLYVPTAVAALLNAKPNYIAPAVHAFYERDLLDIKACQAMKYFPPENRVMSHIKFTKYLYAMLATSKYFPDQRTGWNLPRPHEESYKSHLLGIKVACGFEILISQIKGKGSKEKEIEEVDFENDPNWKKFLKNLSSKNYFRGFLEHSKDYNQLLEGAKDYYKKSCEQLIKPNKAKEICDLLDKLEIDVKELKKKENNLPKSDSDEWMNISQEELDAMLEDRFGRPKVVDKKHVNANTGIAEHLETFINHLSGIEGAEFPNFKKEAHISSKMKKNRVKLRGKKTVRFSSDAKFQSSPSDEKLPNSKSNKIEFEPEGFINAFENILDSSIFDDDYWSDEESGMSSYEDETDTEFTEEISSYEDEIDTEFREINGANSKKNKSLLKYMHEMDQELANTAMGKSFLKKTTPPFNENNEISSNEENFKPIDFQKNAIENMLSSYQAQMGNPGPAENLLGPLGFNLDNIDSSVD